MALELYNPRTQAYESITPPVADLPLSDLLLLNILIELKTLVSYQQDGNDDLDDASDVRTDIVSN